MELNLRINDYPVSLDQELNKEKLENHNFKKAGFFCRLLVKPAKDEIVWWAKNCDLKYLNDDFESSIVAILNTKAGAEFMVGTSGFLWFKEKKLTKLTFQILQNRMFAEKFLNKLKERLTEFIGNPTSSEQHFKVWEVENQKIILEYPKRMHGYIHLMNKNR